MYIVITGKDDGNIAYVERHMDEPFLCIDTRDILEGKALSYEVRDNHTIIQMHGRPIGNIKSVWYRRLMIVQSSELPVAEGKRNYSQHAIRYFNQLLFSQFADALWVSDFYAVERASDKLLQLQVASRIGFKVKATLFTASSNEAAAFAEEHINVIAKPNHSAMFDKDGEAYAFYTAQVDSTTNFSGFHLAPAILQEAVEVKTELRVTVVGKRVFAAAITGHPTQTAGHIRDWRHANREHRLKFAPFELPKSIRDKCILLVKELGLLYGAVDIIIDKKGAYWFLENNPNGQWTFIEDDTGQPISEAIADLLMQKKS